MIISKVFIKLVERYIELGHTDDVEHKREHKDF